MLAERIPKPEKKKVIPQEMRGNEKRFIAAILLLLVALSMGVSATSVSAQSCAVELLTETWVLEGEGGTSAQANQEIDPLVLQGKDTVRVSFDPHDTQKLLTIQESKDASVLIFVQNDWNVGAIVEDDFNGPDWPAGAQPTTDTLSVDIPLAAFEGIGSATGKAFTPNDGVGETMSFRLWNDTDYHLTIDSVKAFNSSECDLPPADHEIEYRPVIEADVADSQVVTQEEPAEPPETPVEPAFEIRSVSTMKLTKDKLADPLSDEEIQKVMIKILELNANFVAIETPYDSPENLDAVGETYRWITAARSARLADQPDSPPLKVHHRHMFGHMEGIYEMELQPRVFGEAIDASLQSWANQITSVPYEELDQYMVQMYKYILEHKTMFENDDIFTPFPEPDIRGIDGYHDCENSFCLWSSAEEFSQGLVNYSLVAQEAFDVLGLQVSVGHYGIGGYVLAGLGNVDRLGETALSCEAIEAMGGEVYTDHYTGPENMAADLQLASDLLEEKCPAEFDGLQIGEYGIEDPEALSEVLAIFAQAGITKMTYWSVARGDTGLLEDNLEETPLYPVVQDFYTRSSQNLADEAGQ